MKKKTKQTWLAIVAMVAGAAVFFLVSSTLEENERRGNVSTGVESENAVVPKMTGYLYFGTPEDTYLAAEPRIFEVPETAAEFGRIIIEELLRGPEKEMLLPTIPENTRLSAFYVDEDKTGYADFSGEITRNHPGGAAAELLTVYSIVNTLTMNIDGIEKVKILIDGREASTLAGHVDLRAPFKPDVMYIR